MSDDTTHPFGEQDEFVDEVFEGVDCRELKLTGREFNACNFVNVVFADATFQKCRFIDCVFKHCDLSNAKFKASTIKDLTCQDSKLLGVDWSEAATVAHLNFAGCVLNFSVFSQTDLRKSRFEGCVAREMDLSEANLSEAVCQGTDFAGTKFRKCNLTKADFRGATNYLIHPGENTLKKTRFSLPEATALLYGLDIILED